MGTEKPAVTPETIGKPASTIPVELSTRFLEHFSEQLYSSPQKAFEELISNGWDAGADCVDVRVSTDLSDTAATMCVLDNGESMDATGLKQLWQIAFSPKQGKTEINGRRIIGKFGIGKLATYVLATKLTYICKASDGKIRRVTMDYSDIDREKDAEKDKLISELSLELFEVTEAEVTQALASVFDGHEIDALIKTGVPKPEGKLSDDEFGGQKDTLTRQTTGTWTLVVLSGLKTTGRELKLGVLRRMLEAALPFGSEMAISLNGELLSSSKLDFAKIKEWTIGPDLMIDSIELPDSEEAESPGEMGSESKREPLKLKVESHAKPFPHMVLPGVGVVTGSVRLFQDRISGGKSEARGASNGFHINVLGRVVNQSDPSFGEENLSHAAWARFRMTVRADGLNQLLTTDREKFREQADLKTFRAFLRKAFNTARTIYDSDQNSGMSDGGDVLVQALGVVSLNPLRSVVADTLKTQAPLPGLFDETGISNREEKRKAWQETTRDNISNALGQVKYERVDDDSFVRFRISDSTIVINKEHPFVAEHTRTKAEKDLMRTIAMVSLLADVYALDIGVPAKTLENIRQYRDRLFRFRALQQRQSGTHIAKLLIQTQHDSSNSKKFEAVVSDALRYLGFHVKELGQSGEPEGVASAFPIPTSATPTAENPNPPLYSFSYDAKSSKHDVASTGNINLAGVVEHRERYHANYALVIAPGYSDGALAIRCEQQQVTPITASALGQLLEFTYQYGAIPLTKLRELFTFFRPEQVEAWVQGVETWLKQKRTLTIDVFLKALNHLKGKVPDVLSADTIALICRDQLKVPTVKNDDVIAVAKGLSILVPDLVGIDDTGKIVVNASAERVAAAVQGQLEKLHEDSPE